MKLTDPYLKTTRAKEHLDALREAHTDFIEGESHLFTFKEDVEGQRYVLKLQLMEVPDRLPLIAGDLFYCLRAALDQLVFALAWKRGGPLPNHTQFPIHDSVAPARRKRFRQNLRGVPADAIRVIDSLQPYNRPNAIKEHLLWRLNEMCILDKHRRIPASGSCIDFQLPPSIMNVAEWKTLSDGAEVSIPLSMKSKMALHPNCTVRVLFGDIHYGVQLTIEEITDIYEFVADKVLPRFTRFFE